MNNFRLRVQALAALGLASLSLPALPADPPIRSQRVQFAKGASSAVVTGRIRGYEVVDYLVNARQGQVANISLATKHTATYFNLMAPGKTEEAFFIGSTAGNQFEGALPDNGDYRIRVYMMRSAARRNETADYRLEVAIAAGSAVAARPAAGDAKVPGTNFHATTELRCSMSDGASAACPAGVVREGQGKGMVTVTLPDGRKRVIFFDKGRAQGYDQSQADKGNAFSVTRQGDTSIVRIGAERYEIPDALVFGG